jgi:hypothetical protein
MKITIIKMNKLILIKKKQVAQQMSILHQQHHHQYPLLKKILKIIKI